MPLRTGLATPSIAPARRGAHPLLLALALLVAATALAPDLGAQERAPRDSIRFDDDGITVTARDGVSALTLRVTAQLLSTVSVPPDDEDGDTELDATVRRARLRLRSTLRDPRLDVFLQLGFAGSDRTAASGSVLDARVAWQQTEHLRFIAGLTSVPGNRQRLVSSSTLQFAERSVVTSTFSLDRDYLVMATWEREGRIPWSWSGSVSAGEGRGEPGPDLGLAYTTRFELQPLGAFSDGNASVEGDLAREPAPRLLLGIAASRNVDAWRSRGQQGDVLLAPRDLTTYFADATLKYRGWALYTEGAYREAGPTSLAVAPGEDPRGRGALVQLSYLTRGGWEPAVRLARVDMRDGSDGSQASLNVTRYLDAHRVKYHLEAGREWGITPSLRSRWLVRASLQAGI